MYPLFQSEVEKTLEIACQVLRFFFFFFLPNLLFLGTNKFVLAHLVISYCYRNDPSVGITHLLITGDFNLYKAFNIYIFVTQYINRHNNLTKVMKTLNE